MASRAGWQSNIDPACLAATFVKRSPRVQSEEWQPVTTPKLIAFAIGAGLFFLLVLRSPAGFVFLVDHGNLLFHEAGLPIVGLVSQRLETYGGTLGQLAFPLILAAVFWKKGQPLSFAGAWIWFFENWLNIARYMADARKLELPLVGGGDHDWNTIFARWNILQYDDRIAGAVKTMGWIGMTLACIWVGWRAWRDRNRIVAPDWSQETKI